ncbi:DUF6615 family protein [Streptomyces sp. NPDC050732]|uniref:DUF6615 family protein n=1 Tax=Streptomyces sp. NPDC050732 TaxID=3154632 RepID=UPI00342ED32E
MITSIRRPGSREQTVWPGMRPSLCALLKWTASDTYHWLRDGYGPHAPPPGEETFTDVHIRHLRQAMGSRVKVIQFNKEQESFNGADWELWIHNRSHGLGFRIQAKRESKERQYGFRYWLEERDAFQCDLLIHDAQAAGCIPVYLLYNYEAWAVRKEAAQLLCGHTAPDLSHYGCSLLSAHQVQAQLFRQALGVSRRVSHVQLREISAPWNQVLCDESGAQDPRGTGPLKAIQRRAEAMERSGWATLQSVDRGDFTSPSHACGGTSEASVGTWFGDAAAEEVREPVLRTLPDRVLGLLDANPLRPPEPQTPTRAVVLYDVTSAEETMNDFVGCVRS